MKIFVKVRAGKKEEKIQKVDDSHFLISVKEVPEKGKANKAVLKLLSKHFDVSISQLKIISGASSKNKTISVF